MSLAMSLAMSPGTDCAKAHCSDLGGGVACRRAAAVDNGAVKYIVVLLSLILGFYFHKVRL